MNERVNYDYVNLMHGESVCHMLANDFAFTFYALSQAVCFFQQNYTQEWPSKSLFVPIIIFLFIHQSLA